MDVSSRFVFDLSDKLSNKYEIIVLAPHLKLPFLPYLPKKIADGYVKIAGRGKEYDVYPTTYSQLAKN